MARVRRARALLLHPASWVAVHGVLAPVLSLMVTVLVGQTAILAGSRGSAEENRAAAFVVLWVPTAILTEAPFLVDVPYTARRVIRLLAGILALGALSFLFMFPFMLGITFSLCTPRGQGMSPGCVAYAMPTALAIVGPILGCAQWQLTRRAGRRALWFLPASTLGMIAFGLVYLLVLGRLLPPGSDMSIPITVAGLAYPIVTVPVLAVTRPRASLSA